MHLVGYNKHHAMPHRRTHSLQTCVWRPWLIVSVNLGFMLHSVGHVIVSVTAEDCQYNNMTFKRYDVDTIDYSIGLTALLSVLKDTCTKVKRHYT